MVVCSEYSLFLLVKGEEAWTDTEATNFIQCFESISVVMYAVAPYSTFLACAAEALFNCVESLCGIVDTQIRGVLLRYNAPEFRCVVRDCIEVQGVDALTFSTYGISSNKGMQVGRVHPLSFLRGIKGNPSLCRVLEEDAPTENKSHSVIIIPSLYTACHGEPCFVQSAEQKSRSGF